MAKLTRVSQKVFGQTAGISQLGIFGSFAAGSPAYTTDPAVVQSLSNFSDGWFAAVVGQNSPAIQDMNSLCFLYAYQLAYILQQGIPEWDAGTTYYVGSIAQDGAGNSYTSLQNNNLNNALTNTSFWAIKGGAIRTVTTTATAASTDDLIRADSTAGAFTITLPAVASVAVGKIYTFKFVGGANFVTIKGNGSQLIDLANTYVLHGVEESVSVENNGTTWDIISFYVPSVTPTGTTVPVGGLAISAFVNYNAVNNFLTIATGLSVTITTSGRPIYLGLKGNTGGGGTLAVAPNDSLTLSFYDGTTDFTVQSLNNPVVTGRNNLQPSSAFNATVLFPAGTYTFSVRAASGTGNSSIGNSALVVYELR